MIYIPFICLAAGFAISLFNLSPKAIKKTDLVVNIALILLMLTIGVSIGVDKEVISNLGTIGFNCLIISLFAIALSVACMVLLEKTILPLEKIKEDLYKENIDFKMEGSNEDSKKKISPLIIIMPGCIVLGIVAGWFFLQNMNQSILDKSLTGALIVLYTGVGVSIGNNRKVFLYIKKIGLKILLIPLGLMIGSLAGGLLAGIVLGEPLHVTTLSAAGMSYYSITGAYMTSAFGIAVGAYGFLVNVMREFLTVLLIPILARITKGSPIASAAAGGMDTMLMPIMKSLGVELGLVTLMVGTILTIVVPIWLPIIGSFF